MADTIINTFISNLLNFDHVILTCIILVTLAFSGYAYNFYKSNERLIIPLVDKKNLKYYIYGFIHASLITTTFSLNINDTVEPLILVLIYPAYFAVVCFPSYKTIEISLLLSFVLGFLHFQLNYNSPIMTGIIIGYSLVIWKRLNPNIKFWDIRRY